MFVPWLRVTVFTADYKLGLFGGLSEKPVKIFSECQEFLARIAPPPGTVLVDEYIELGERFWDDAAGVWRFTGYGDEVKRSQAYPYWFGEACVRRFES